MLSKKVRSIRSNKTKKINPKYKIPFYVYLPILIGLGCLILTFLYITVLTF